LQANLFLIYRSEITSYVQIITYLLFMAEENPLKYKTAEDLEIEEAIDKFISQ